MYRLRRPRHGALFLCGLLADRRRMLRKKGSGTVSFKRLLVPVRSSIVDAMTRDINQIAARIVEESTKSGKNPAAVMLGRLGGLKGGKARAAALSAKKRKEIARKAAAKRWNKK